MNIDAILWNKRNEGHSLTNNVQGALQLSELGRWVGFVGTGTENPEGISEPVPLGTDVGSISTYVGSLFNVN